LKNPNPRMSRSEFFEYIGGSLELDGNAFVVPVNPTTRKGTPLALYPLRPDLVQVDEVKLNGIYQFRYTYTPAMDGELVEEPTTYLENEIIHIKLYNPVNGLRGAGPITAARNPMDRSNASEKWNYSLQKNSAKQSGILTTDQGIANANQKEQLEKKRDSMIGMLNAGKPPVLTNGLKWQSISLSPLDMDWLQGDQNADVKIARAFRVPGQKIGIPGSMTFANMEQANRALSEDAIVPLGMRILDKLNSKLAPLYGEGLEMLIDIDAIPAMRDSQNDLYTRANTGWWLRVDEKRQMTGYQTVGGKMGNMIMVPAGLIPLDVPPFDIKVICGIAAIV
jgi:HK97 family phage portal protein